MSERWNHEQARTVLAWALWEAGRLSWAAAMVAMDDASKVPVFRCQGPECFSFADTCGKCGERLPKGWAGWCADCEAIRAELYEPSGRRRIFRGG